MADYNKLFKVSAAVGGTSWVLAWLYSKFAPGGIAKISFSVLPVDINVGNQIASGINTTLAGKVLGTLGGSIPASITTILTLLLAAAGVVFVGNFLDQQFGISGFVGAKTPNGKFAVKMGIGAALIGMIAGWMSPNIGTIGIVIAMVLYYLIVAIVYNLARKYLGADGFLPALD